MWGKLLKEIVTAAGREAIDKKMKKGAVNKAASQNNEEVFAHISGVSYHPNHSVLGTMVGELSITSMAVRFSYRPHVSLKILPTQIEIPRNTVTNVVIERVKLGLAKPPVMIISCEPFPAGAKPGSLFFLVRGKGMDRAKEALIRLLGADKIRDSR